MGKYKNPTICDEENLEALSKLIKNVEFICGDYQTTEAIVDKNTFVYFDPPYRPLSVTSGFTSYTKDDFDDEDQNQLASYFRTLDTKDAKLMLSNSNPKNVSLEDKFFEEIYDGFNLNEVMAHRNINSKGKKRGKVEEVIITNYENKRGFEE